LVAVEEENLAKGKKGGEGKKPQRIASSRMEEKGRLGGVVEKKRWKKT